MTTSATDVLQIFTVLNHGKLRGCEMPISLIKAKSASGFSRRRNTVEIAPLLADVPRLQPRTSQYCEEDWRA